MRINLNEFQNALKDMHQDLLNGQDNAGRVLKDTGANVGLFTELTQSNEYLWIEFNDIVDLGDGALGWEPIETAIISVNSLDKEPLLRQIAHLFINAYTDYLKEND